jgi:hypothetical protein
MSEPQLDPDPVVSERMHRLVGEIVRQLRRTELPAYIGQHIRDESAKFGARSSQAVIEPGPMPMMMEHTLFPDGSIRLQMTDWNRQIFWRAHLRPQDA